MLIRDAERAARIHITPVRCDSDDKIVCKDVVVDAAEASTPGIFLGDSVRDIQSKDECLANYS